MNKQDFDGDAHAEALLNDVAALINADRDTHGDCVEQHVRAAEGWTWYLRASGHLLDDQAITAADVERMMALLKVSRAGTGVYCEKEGATTTVTGPLAPGEWPAHGRCRRRRCEIVFTDE